MASLTVLTRTAVVIAAYNEGSIVRQVISDIRKIFPNVICVDDGSMDSTAVEADAAGAIVLQHRLNIGQGGALETGVTYALSKGFDYYITMDADGQHCPSDAFDMVTRLASSNLDIVLGSRFLTAKSNMDLAKRLGLGLAVLISRVLHRLPISDVHNGLRAFNARTAALMKFKNTDMAHASDLYDIIRSNALTFAEHPVVVQYTTYSRSKGQSITNAFNILIDYLLSSITSHD